MLGGQTWCGSCQEAALEANPSEAEPIPLNFESIDHYLSVFEPLLQEEARSGWVVTMRGI